MLVFINQDFLSANKSTLSNDEKNSIYNISSVIECGVNSSELIPPLYFDQQMVNYEDRNFDIWYASYILNNNHIFSIFFSIIYDIYMGKNVYCVFQYSERLYCVLESLLKLIQQRYGINANIVNEEIDLEVLEKTEFSIGGVHNLDIDKFRYVNLFSDEKIKEMEKGYIKQEEILANHSKLWWR